MYQKLQMRIQKPFRLTLMSRGFFILLSSDIESKYIYNIPCISILSIE